MGAVGAPGGARAGDRRPHATDEARTRTARLRIVAGTLRGRKILAPLLAGVRPTSEKVREALFDILGPSVREGRVLDAFAGSGANGFEALSRGARSVVFIESDRAVVRVLRENVSLLAVEDRSRIVFGSAVSAHELQGLGPFELILADPPYSGDLGSTFARQAVQTRLLAACGRLVLERSSRAAAVEVPGLRLARSAAYGDTRLDFYETCEP